MVVCVEDAEADAGVSEIAADGELELGQTVVGEEVGACDDGEDVDADGETTDGVDVGWREGGADGGRVDGVWVEKVDAAGEGERGQSGEKRSRTDGHGGGRGRRESDGR